MNIIIFFPSKTLMDEYWDRENILYFNEEGLYVSQEGRRRVIDIFNDLSCLKCDQFSKVSENINKLRLCGPLWSRWISCGDQMELLMRYALLDIHKIAEQLRQRTVDVAIFNTGVAHHIDTMICEQACILLGISQIYLYSINVIKGRLLPLVQVTGVADRRRLDLIVSKNISVESVKDFYENKENGNPPKIGGELNFQRFGFHVSLISALVFLLRSILKVSRNLVFSNRQVDIFGKYKNKFYFSDFLRQIVQQRKALLFYQQNCMGFNSRLGNKTPAILIAAHYQPEATSFPEGLDLHNHIDIVMEIRRLGYAGRILYKEHPASFLYTGPIIGFSQVGMYRSKIYYEQLIELGCDFLDRDFELSLSPCLTSCYIPVTITGTIALERSLAGYHTIVTGYPWYIGMPGVISLRSLESLTQINPAWVKPDLDLAKSARHFLSSVLDGKTITNATGIGTASIDESETEKVRFLQEFENMLVKMESNWSDLFAGI